MFAEKGNMTGIGKLVRGILQSNGQNFSDKERRQDYVDGKIGKVFDASVAELLVKSHLS